jgi:hypothetical protein
MMTAVAAGRYADLSPDLALTERVVEALDEETLVSLLQARFRAFVACGYEAVEALLLAVGYPNTDSAVAGAIAECRGSQGRRSSA